MAYITKDELLTAYREAKQKGILTDKLANMFLLMVNKLATDKKYNRYSYLEDMKAQALFVLCKNWECFDDEFADKFPYYKMDKTAKKPKAINYSQDDYDKLSDQEKSTLKRRYINPFAYYTQTINTAFWGVIKKENKIQKDKQSIIDKSSLNKLNYNEIKLWHDEHDIPK